MVLYRDGRTVTVGPSYTTETRLPVAPGLPRCRVVMVTADLSRAAAKGVRDVAVTVRPIASDTPIAELTFTPGTPAQAFRFDHLTDADVAYRYRVTEHRTNGLDRTSDWAESSAIDLAVGIG
jgi:hypothetical protein